MMVGLVKTALPEQVAAHGAPSSLDSQSVQTADLIISYCDIGSASSLLVVFIFLILYHLHVKIIHIYKLKVGMLNMRFSKMIIGIVPVAWI